MATSDDSLASSVFMLTCGSEQGSAFLVSSTYALTSRHCVQEHLDDDEPILLVDPSTSIVHSCYVAEIYIPEGDDVVVLQLEQALGNERVLPLVASHIPAGLPWNSFGYPRTRAKLGASLSGETGRSLNADVAAWDVELMCDPGSTFASYEGASGAPVVVAGAVRAMLQRSIDGALGAISLRRMKAILKANGVQFASEHRVDRLPQRIRAELERALPNSKSAADLERAIGECGEGCVLLVGTPGSGKSVLVAGFAPVAPTTEVVCSYFAGEPGLNDESPALQRLPRTFAEWLCRETALVSAKAVAPPRDATLVDCATCIAKNLQAISEAFRGKGMVAVVIIDDPCASPADGGPSLLEALPAKPPGNVVVVLTTSDEATFAASMRHGKLVRRVEMAPLPRRDAEALALMSLPDEAQYSFAIRLAEASKGHPLVLALMLRQYRSVGGDVAESGAVLESVELQDYYEHLWSRVSASGACVWLLATLACLRGVVGEVELLEMTPPEQRENFPVAFLSVRHFLHLDKRGVSFYHESFRSFVGAKVGTLTQSVHRNLRDYCRQHASSYALGNLLFHQLEAEPGLTGVDLAACNQELFDRAAGDCCDPELLLADLGRMVERVVAAGNLPELFRLLLLRNRVRFRYNVVFAEYAHELAIAVLGLRGSSHALPFLHRQGIFVCEPSEIADFVRRLSLRGQHRAAEEFFQRFRIKCWDAYESGDARMTLFDAHFEATTALAPSRPKMALAELGALRGVFDAQFEGQANGERATLLRTHIWTYISAEGLWRAGYTGAMPRTEANPAHHALKLALTLYKAHRLARTYGPIAPREKPDRPDVWDAAAVAKELEDTCTRFEVTEELPITIDVLVRHGADPEIVAKLWIPPSKTSLREANGVDLDSVAFRAEFDAGKVCGYCDRTLVPPPRVVRASWERRFLDAALHLGRIAGEAARHQRSGALVGDDVLAQLERDVWPLQTFELRERVSWEDSYAIPEAASAPHVI